MEWRLRARRGGGERPLPVPADGVRPRDDSAHHARALIGRQDRPGDCSPLNAASISANGTARARLANVPCSAISLAAVRNPPQAARASAPPTLMRRTPIAAISVTVVKSEPTSMLTGFGVTA